MDAETKHYMDRFATLLEAMHERESALISMCQSLSQSVTVLAERGRSLTDRIESLERRLTQ